MYSRLAIQGAWWLRDESLDDAVRRLNDTFHRLADLSCEWNNWRRAYKDMADRQKGPVLLMDETNLIRQELIDGRSEYNGAVNDDLGYFITPSAGPLKGKGTESSFIWLHCCTRTPYAGFNSIALELPTESARPAIYDADLLSRAVAALAEVWDPDWLAVWDRVTKVVAPPWEGGPVLGWVNYLPKRTGVIDSDLPPGWKWSKSRGDKQIFVYKGGAPDASKRNDVSSVEQMTGCIRWGTPPPQCVPVTCSRQNSSGDPSSL